uniref:BZIP domain-containing protein n=1 Tax=Strongyloides venezuelensis TaxID=75913 RepID=A0A0K0FYL8_STRVS
MMKVSLNNLTEQQKRDLRRLNNKKAAQRCRERKVAKVKKLESDVNSRNEIIESLKIELERYKSSCQLMANYLLSQGVDLRSIGISEDIIYGKSIITQNSGEINENSEIPMEKNAITTSYTQTYSVIKDYSNVKQEYINDNQYQYQQGSANIYNTMVNKNNQMAGDDFYQAISNNYDREVSEKYINCEVSKIHIDDRVSVNHSYNENINDTFVRPSNFTVMSGRQKIERPSGFNFNMENLTNEKIYLPLDIVTPQMPLFMDESLMSDYLSSEVHTSNVNNYTCN